MAADLQELEAKLGYEFRDRTLLVRALTHSSFSSESRPTQYQPHNEQLEFLGDSILGFLVSEHLVSRYPEYHEGQLSVMKSHLVSARWLFEVAQQLGLGEFLNLGRSEDRGGGRSKRSLLADGVEALIAGLYLDGGIDVARRFVQERVYHEPLHIALNYKGLLWDRTSGAGLPKPQYHVLEETGPQHAPHFVVEARVGEQFTGRGAGMTKKSAEQNAARELLEQMDRETAEVHD
jgi:ribonuclease-3